MRLRLAVAATALLLPSSGPLAEDPAQELVEISAPIFPKVEPLYVKEGPNYPATQDERAMLVASAALTYQELLTHCPTRYPDFKVWQSGDPFLTHEELQANYRVIARCAYEEFTAKPYWIPRLIQDVDICQAELGADWRLITEQDLATLSEEDFALVERELAADPQDEWAMFFSAKVFLRGSDGTIKQGDLTPGQSQRVAPLAPPCPTCTAPFDDTVHYEGQLALRCIKRTPL